MANAGRCFEGREPAALEQIGGGITDPISVDHILPPALSVLAKHGVFETLDFPHDSGFLCFGTIQAFARHVEKVGVGLGVCRKGLIVAARDDAGLVCLPPFQFQIVHLRIEVDVETAHGFLPLA
jgi:hypothetical protein